MTNDLTILCVCVCVCVCTLRPVQLLGTPWTVACQVPLSMEFSRQEHWSGLPFPSPVDLPDPGSNPCLLSLLRQQADCLPLSTFLYMYNRLHRNTKGGGSQSSWAGERTATGECGQSGCTDGPRPVSVPCPADHFHSVGTRQ